MVPFLRFSDTFSREGALNFEVPKITSAMDAVMQENEGECNAFGCYVGYV